MKRKQPLPWKPEPGEKYELETTGNASVKIYRRERVGWKDKKRFVFEVADYSSGRRVMRTFKDNRKARSEAKRIADALASGEQTAAALTNGDAASFGRATEILRPTGASLELAATVYAKAFEMFGADRVLEACSFLKQHGADQITPRMVPEVVAELLEVKKARGGSVRYLSDLDSRLTRFAKVHVRDIASVTTADVQKYIDRMKIAASTARTVRAKLFALFAFAESHGYIHKGGNPVQSVQRIKTNGEGDILIYSPDELAKLLAAASKDFLPVLAIGAFAGVRTAELLRLEWRDIDLPGGFIHVGKEKAKTRSRRLVPIAANLRQWLEPYATRKGKVWKGDQHDLDDARLACAEKAGVPWKANALRHSFISYRLAEIQDAAKVSLEAGNSPKMVFRHYRELVKPDAAKAYFAIAPEAPANVITMKQEVA